MAITLQGRTATSILSFLAVILGSLHLAQAQPDDLQRPASEKARQEALQYVRQTQEEDWRWSLTNDGVKDTATQDAVIAVLGKQQELLYPLQRQSELLAQAVASKKVPDVQVAAMLDELRVALRAEKQRRAVALAGLKAQINYEQNPRLETPLMFFGVVGDEANFLDSVPQALRRLRVGSVTDAMRMLGITDPQVKEPIVGFVAQQEKLSEPFLEWARESNEIVQRKTDQPTEETRRFFLTTFRGGAKKLQTRSQNALLKLDGAIGYTRNPRLEASLFLMGILGNESFVLNGFNSRGSHQFTRYEDTVTGAQTPWRPRTRAPIPRRDRD